MPPKKEIPRLVLEGQLELSLPDGSIVRLRPGSYNKGISITAVQPKIYRGRRTGPTGAPRGRKPRPSTVKLREKLARDIVAGPLAPPREYVRWIMRGDPGLTLAVARQVVYRERRAVQEGKTEAENNTR